MDAGPAQLKQAVLTNKKAGRTLIHALKFNSDLTLKTARRHEVCAAEGGQEVVERHLVGQVNDCKSQGHARALRAEQVVCPGAQVKEMTRRNARRIRIVVL